MTRPENIVFTRGQLLAFLPYGRLTDSLNQALVDAKGSILVVKYLAGLPGDAIDVKNDHVAVAGRNFGALDLLEKLNRAPGSYDRHQVLLAGQLAMMGTEKRSFDARYWGPINFEEVVGVVYPIW
jgi:conjugal transfer pilin signal peptidase TrbI